MSLCGTVLFNVSFSPLFWHFQPLLISEGFSCLPGVLRGRTERRAAFFCVCVCFLFVFFGALATGLFRYLLRNNLRERERERGLILSLHAMLCLSGEKKKQKKKTSTFVRQAGQDNHPSCPPWQGTTPRVAEKWKPPQVFTPRPSV